MKRCLLFLLLICSLSLQSCGELEGGTSKTMQEDFDRIRLDHILVIHKLIAEYKSETGHFPFEGRSDLPAVVLIASEEQLRNNHDRIPIFIDLETRAIAGKTPAQPATIEEYSTAELARELGKALKRPVALPLDPQKVPVNKPTLYIYTYYLGVFDITAFLHNRFSFARPIKDFFNKITVGSRSDPRVAIWTPEELMAETDFRAFFSAPFHRAGYQLQTELE